MNLTQTKYLGIQLRNPIMVSSSGLSSSVSKIEKLADAGAGAIVLKSIFEEQIRIESDSLVGESSYPEAADYVAVYSREHALDQFLKLIEEVKTKVDIPIFGSINCISAGEWVSFAESMQDAGVDGLELNIFYVPVSVHEKRTEYEKTYLDILSSLKKKVTVPIAIKLGQNFSHLPSFVDSLNARGADGVVLFNRFYAPDIDTHNLSLVSSEVLSNPADIRESLRWIAILSALLPRLDLCASTGIHDGQAVIKQLLAGAKAVQVCSVLYKKGVEYLATMIRDAERWMDEHNYKEIAEFRGRLNYKNVTDPMVFERVQFMKYYSGVT